MTSYAQMPLIMPNFIALGQTMYEKSVTIFYTLQYFGASVEPPVDFVDGVTDTRTHTHTNNQAQSECKHSRTFRVRAMLS